VTLPDQVLSDTVGAVVVRSEATGDPTRYDESADLVRVQRVVSVTLASDESGEAEPEQVVTYVHTLGNTGNAEDLFTLDVTSVWNAVVAPAVLTVPAYSSHLVTVTLQALAGVPSGTMQTVVVTATSQTSPAVYATVADATTVKVGTRYVYLPLVVRNR
jgi:hypothetical protein